MSKHNYSQYSNKKKQNESVEPVEVMEPVEVDVPQAAPEVKMVEETVETVTLPSTVKGVVVDCARLNVRAKPTTDSAVVCVLDVNTEVQVDTDNRKPEWFYVYTATGVEGYCMKKFIKATL